MMFRSTKGITGQIEGLQWLYWYISRKVYSSEARKPFLPVVPLNLFSLFCAIPHSIEDRSLAFDSKRVRVNTFKQGERTQMCFHPFGEIFHIRDSIYDTTRT